MTNVPTELLRTLVAVVDLRSFTKAAHSLGVTQPAVSAQIKRLQSLLNCELLDKSAPGVCLTPLGEHIVSQARRLLSINDQILDLAEPVLRARTLRFGLPGDSICPAVWANIATFCDRWPDLRLQMRASDSEALLRALHQGELDLVVVTSSKPLQRARHHWTEETVWMRGPYTKLDPSQPVPLISRGGHCLYHRYMVEALEGAGRAYSVVLTGSRINDLSCAVTAGLGTMALPRSFCSGSMVWEEAPLPKLADTVCNVCVRDDVHVEALDRLADVLADIWRQAAQEANGRAAGQRVRFSAAPPQPVAASAQAR